MILKISLQCVVGYKDHSSFALLYFITHGLMILILNHFFSISIGHDDLSYRFFVLQK